MKVVIADVSGVNDMATLRHYYRQSQGVPKRVQIVVDKGFRITRAYRVNQLGMTFVLGRDGGSRWQGVWGGDTSALFPAIEGAAAR